MAQHATAKNYSASGTGGTIERAHWRSAELWPKLLQQFGMGQHFVLHVLSQGLFGLGFIGVI